MGDASGAFVAALAHLTEASFPFPKIWSLYPAILGQAIPSAFGRFRLAVTILHTILLESIPLNLITYLFQWIIMELKAAVAK